MRIKALGIGVLLALTLAASEDFYPSEIGEFSLARDIRYYDPEAVERVLDRINAEPTKTPGLYKRWGGPDKVYYLRFQVDTVVAETRTDSKVILYDTLFDFVMEKGDKFYRLGFDTYRGTNIVANHPIRLFVNSAYLQEIDSTYVERRKHLFIDLPEKSDAEFWKRNIIHMGYGAQYIYRDNPFTAGGWLPIGFGYLWDTMNYIMIFGGPFFGGRTTDKITIPLLGIASSLLSKTVFNGWIVKSHLNEYNNLVRSGYRIPKYVFPKTLHSRYRQLQ